MALSTVGLSSAWTVGVSTIGLGGMYRGVVPQATDLPSTRTGTCKVPDAKTLSRLAPTLGPE